jgi:hypothetical protein
MRGKQMKRSQNEGLYGIIRRSDGCLQARRMNGHGQLRKCRQVAWRMSVSKNKQERECGEEAPGIEPDKAYKRGM